MQSANGKLETSEGAALLTRLAAAKDRSGDHVGAFLDYNEALRIHRLVDTYKTLECVDALEGSADSCFGCGGDARVALQSLQEACNLRKLLHALDSPEGARLVVKIGDVHMKQ